MKSRKSKIIIIIGIILIGLLFSIWCINKFILPAKVKGLIVSVVKEKTGYDIAIGRISYLPLSQFYLSDVTLYDKETPPSSLINIKGLSFSFKIWPFLKKRDIIGRLGLKDLIFGNIKISGVTSLLLNRRPSFAHRPFLKNLDGTIRFVNFSVATNILPFKIERITGAIIFEDNVVYLSNTYFNYRDTVYNMEGVLSDLDKDEPRASLSLKSNLLTSEGEFIVKDEYIKINNIQGTLYSSSYNIMGDIKDLYTPLLHLYCQAKIDLSDLNKLFVKSKYVLDSLKPAGLCDAAIFFNGRLNKLKDSEGSIKLSSNKVFLHGLALDRLYLDLRMKEGLVSTPRFDLRPYLGLCNGSFNLDLNKEDLPYSITFALKDGNLAKFSSDMNFGKEDIKGLISSKCFLKGKLTSIDTLKGSGWITVADGHLWEMPLLNGVTDLLSMPLLRSVVFKEAAGNFIIEQKKVSTEDLTFYSDSVNMTATGFADFDGNIDFMLNTNITQDLIEGSSDVAEIANMLISEAGNYMGRIKITGTWKKPEYKFATNPIGDVLKKEVKEIKDLLQDILR